MTIQDLGSIGELVAALATLVNSSVSGYTGQTCKTTVSRVHTNRLARNSLLREAIVPGISRELGFQPDGQNKTMTKALLTEEALTTEENFEFTVQMCIFFGEMLNSEYLHSHELVDSELLVLRKSIFSAYLMMPRVRQYWKSYGRQFYADNIFTDVVEQIIEEIEQRPTV